MSFDLAKHGLNLKKGFKTNLVSFWRTKNGNEERRRGEGEEEEEEKRKKRRGGDQEKGMELLTLSMEHGFLVWILGFFLVNGYLLYSNLGFVRTSS